MESKVVPLPLLSMVKEALFCSWAVVQVSLAADSCFTALKFTRVTGSGTGGVKENWLNTGEWSVVVVPDLFTRPATSDTTVAEEGRYQDAILLLTMTLS